MRETICPGVMQLERHPVIVSVDSLYTGEADEVRSHLEWSLTDLRAFTQSFILSPLSPNTSSYGPSFRFSLSLSRSASIFL